MRKTILRAIVLYSILSLMRTGTSFASYSGKLISAQYDSEVMAGVDDLNVTVTVQNTGTEEWNGSYGRPSWIFELTWQENGWTTSIERRVYESVLPGHSTEATVTLSEEDIPDLPGTYSYVQLYAYYPESSYPSTYYNMTDSPRLITFTVINSTEITGDFCGANSDQPDGYVDYWDLLYFAQRWHTSPSDNNWDPRCDLDKEDDYVDYWDLLVFAQQWHKGQKL